MTISMRAARKLSMWPREQRGRSPDRLWAAHYGLDEIIDLANLSGGPPFCPRCGGTGTPDSPSEPLLSGNPQVNYPSTPVRFFLGEKEPTQYIIDNANEYFNAITSEKRMQIVPKTPHAVHHTQEGTAALIAAVRKAVTAQW